MTQPAKVQEPSMEEILASIRRIIADDESKPIAEIAAEAQAAAAAQLDAGRRELAEKAGGAAPKPDGFRMTATSDPSRPHEGLRAVPSETVAARAPATLNAPVAAPAAGGHAGTASAPGDDILELTDDMAMPSTAANGFRKIEPMIDLEFTEGRSTTARSREANAQGAADASVAPEVMSRATVSAVESAFNSLAATVLSNNARTLEDLVKEMLRPMLKNWLDDNLPSLVERLVRAEIERVSRGR